MGGITVEYLESRKLLSITPAGVWTIRGTPGDDNFKMYQIADDGTGRPAIVFANPTGQTSGVVRTGTGRVPNSIPLVDVSRIVILAGAGNDTIDFGLATYSADGGTAVAIPVRIDGGKGDDMLFGGSADDILIGGAGADHLSGNDGADRITGGAGADVFAVGDAMTEQRDFNARRGDTLLSNAVPDANSSDGKSLSTIPTPSNAQTISVADKFTFKAAPDLVGGPLQGIESLVGKYENANFELTYDYGWNSSNAPSEGYQLTSITVDGKPATLATKDGVVAVFIPHVEGLNALSVVIQLKNNAAAVAATALISTIDFPA